MVLLAESKNRRDLIHQVSDPEIEIGKNYFYIMSHLDGNFQIFTATVIKEVEPGSNMYSNKQKMYTCKSVEGNYFFFWPGKYLYSDYTEALKAANN